MHLLVNVKLFSLEHFLLEHSQFRLLVQRDCNAFRPYLRIKYRQCALKYYVLSESKACHVQYKKPVSEILRS